MRLCFSPAPFFDSIPHQEPDPPGSRGGSVHNHLVASLPLEEEPPGGPVRQAGLVVPHQVPAHEATVVPGVQRGVEEEGVILRSEGTKRNKSLFFLQGPKITQIPTVPKSEKKPPGGTLTCFQ